MAPSMEAVEAELISLQAEEQDLDLELDKLYSKAAHLCQSESRSLAFLGEQHKQVPGAIRKLQETLQQTSGVADELSFRVRKLDVVCSRVFDALKLVDDLLELRECSDQVMKAITSEDFEQAARFVSRFRACQDSLPPGTDDATVRTLTEAERQLSAIVRRRFEAAMAAKDTAGVSRFAKLFHPLGLASEGVQKYVEFIQRSLAEKASMDIKRQLGSAGAKRADQGPAPYAEALTSVFVAIADIVQEHQQAVEQEFGPENFVVVVRGLLDEADVQGIKVIDKFSKDNSKVFSQQFANSEMRDVGAVLEETAMITQRVQQFNAYIHSVARNVVDLIEDKASFVSNLPVGHCPHDGLPDTKLLHRVQELVSSYVLVEQNFLLQSVEKAVTETDCLDPDDPDAFTTTLIDEAFYIMQESMMRSVTTCDINAVCAVVNNVNAAIVGELRQALASNLADSRRVYSNWLTHPKNLVVPKNGEHPLASLFLDQDGKLRSPLTAALSWPHSMNNLQQCLENLDKLKETVEEAFDEYFPGEGPDKDKHEMFRHCIAALAASKADLEALHSSQCKDGLNILKIHLRPMLEPLDKLDYNISEAQYADFQVNDPFAKAFNAQADVIHQHIKAVLNASSAEEIMQQMAEQTCRRIEKAALSKHFSLFGALQFESDVRAICSFFTSVSEQALRHKFARLFEMSSLLNLESLDELRELCSDLRTWRLTSDEMQKLLQSRVDFEATEDQINYLLPK
ncbi:COG4 [Symbiodinium pilosum]|uniref:Conserved oligomeric Golgi complex subunit 4 n=1 Tax=Symbiodinium pilosum TaxID=2952 RepID=A0A812WL37_SYMPI|nr:COG4 [Symbiodinium pilosum]